MNMQIDHEYSVNNNHHQDTYDVALSALSKC